MTEEGWQEAVIKANRRADEGDLTLLTLMSKLLAEQDEAKDRLNKIGFGCIGMPWLNVVEEIRKALDR